MKHFTYTDGNKRYHTLDYFYKHKFGSKVFKVSLNAGFSCPNLDGTKGYGGCIYCSKDGSGDYAGNVCDHLSKQFETVLKVMKQKWDSQKYIAYFQARTNTYAPLEVLKEKYETALKLPHVIGLSIATRPDAISKECLDYLEELNTRTYLTIELGLQTIHEKTSDLINRCHSLECFTNMVQSLRKRNINVVVHIINGLPYETKEMMIETIKYLNQLDIQGIKIHMLHMLKDTKLYELYQKQPFHILTREEYVNIVCDQLEILRPEIVIHRITGDPKEDDLVEPKWLVKKFGVLNEIDKELKRRDTYQGFQKNILNKTHQIIDHQVKKNDLAIDATVGNGFDSLYLLDIVTEGKLFGFDIQEEAIKKTNQLLKQHQKENYQLYQQGHEHLLDTLPNYKHKISLIIFNLGYLPKGDKSIRTKPNTTIQAIDQGYQLLNNKGIILITVYPDTNQKNTTGKEEEQDLLKHLREHYPNQYTIYHNTDNQNAPYLIELKYTKEE